MAYWITLKKGDVRNGFSAASAQDALAVLEAKLAEGYQEVRIIHPDGYEISAHGIKLAAEQLRIAAASVEWSD